MNTYQKGQISKIKLVIWDLDETFWKGTIDDGDVPVIPESHIELVKALTDHGIVNSICSKNNKDKVKAVLTEKGIWDLFVFPSIDWSAKGNRIKSMLEEMGLRAVNTLFIDDNHLNIEEVEFCVPGIITAYPDDIEELFEEVSTSDLKVDEAHKRLNQYKVLEEKAEEKSTYGSARDFLLSCHIKLDIHTDCATEEPRIYELIHRSNQLNFTKVRSSEEEVKAMLADPNYKCGTVWVNDRFGDYGMVGFYAVKNGRAEHFLFSCRTIGMGIEQYVYQILGCPEITVVGEVISELGSKEPLEWINVSGDQDNAGEAESINGKAHSVLIKGPCDMDQIFNFIKNKDIIDSEFTYVDRRIGVTMQGPQHSVQILENLTLNDDQKRSIAEELPFASDDFFDTNMFTGDYKYVFLSMLHESHLGIYRRKNDGVKVVFGEAAYPMTDERFFDDYVNEKVYTGGCKITRSFLEWFAENYEFCGHTKTEELRENILSILSHLKKNAKLILMLGVEYPCKANTNPAFFHSHEVFAEHNRMIRELAEENKRIGYIYYGDFLNGQDGFYNNNYHFTPAIYYKVAVRMCEIINEGGDAISTVSSDKIAKAEMMKKLRHNPIVDFTIRVIKRLMRIGK